MVNSRVKRQLEQNQISPRTLQSFRQQLPQIHEHCTGTAAQIQTCSTGRYHFKYIQVPLPIKLYAVRILATNYAPGYPATVSTIGVALYKPITPVPGDGVDMGSAATGTGPRLELIASSDTIYSADSANTAAAKLPDNLPTTWGLLYFETEPLLLPGNDYYLAFSTYAGDGTFGFWTDCTSGSNTNANGWHSAADTVPSDNSFPKYIEPTERGLPTPACHLHSRHGLKRTGYRIS